MDTDSKDSTAKEAREPSPVPYDVFRGLVAHSQPVNQGGMEYLSGCLPKSDMGLHLWLERALASHDGMAFDHMIRAAAMKDRKLKASLLPDGAALISDRFQRAWIAWHMEGDVADALVKAAGNAGMSRPDRAQMLFYAAAWWAKFREGPLPGALTTAARTLARMKPVNGESAVTLAALTAVAPHDALQDLIPCGRHDRIVTNSPKIRDGLLEMIEGEFFTLVPIKREHGYTLGRPMRRSTDKIGRNEPCPCGSGKIYKKCCIRQGAERLRHSSDVAGKTDVELHYDPGAGLTEARLQAMPPDEMVRIQQIPAELTETYLLRLAGFNRFDEVVRFFKKNGVPEKWEEIWKRLFGFMVRAWQPDTAHRLLKTHADPKRMLPRLGVDVKLMLSSNKKYLTTLEAEAVATLKEEDSKSLQELVNGVICSPYPALGILVCRGVLPILADHQKRAEIYKSILAARDRLNLTPEDALGDWMDDQAANEGEDDDKVLELQDELDRKRAEERKLKQQLAEFKRKIALAEKHEKRAAFAAAPASTPSDDGVVEELRRKAKTTAAILRERGDERLQLRRELHDALEKVAKLEAESRNGSAAADDDDGDGGEPLEVCGNQPTRLTKFPKNFAAAIAPLKAHVKRAGLKTIGHVASGEESAFGGVKNLKGYHGVLRKRVAGGHRLLFTLSPEYVWIVALIPRGRLDATVEHLQKHGLPAYD